jgi:hypothetical protein
MRKNAPEYTKDHTYLHKREAERTQGLHKLDAVIVSGGKTVNEIKAMHVLEKKKHAEVCNKNRSISAQSVNELATKMGCPSDYTTKLSKLGWIFLQLQA